MASPINDFLELARREFEAINPAEEILLKAVAFGMTADLTATDEGRRESIRAALLRWLCIDRRAGQYIDEKGVHVRGATVTNRLDLSFVNLRFPLSLITCSVPDGIDLTEASTRALSFNGSKVGSLRASQLNARGSVYLRDRFSCEFGVSFRGASIFGNLELGKSILRNPDGDALQGSGMHVSGSIHMDDGFVAYAPIRLEATTVDKSLVCSGGRFINRRGIAISADGIKIGNMALLDQRFLSLGEVRFQGATIQADFSCRSARMYNPRRDVLVADGIRIGASANLNRGFRAIGRIRFVGAEIKRDLTLRDASLRNKKEDALSGERMAISGSVFFDGAFRSNSFISMGASVIAGDLHFRNSTFLSGGKTGVSLENASVKGKFFWKNIQTAPDTLLDLTYAAVGQLADEEKSWPAKGRLQLNGFTYQMIIEGPVNARKRLDWLMRQDYRTFQSQPFDHLAHVFNRLGKTNEAMAISVAREDQLLKTGDLSMNQRLQQWFMKVFVNYGYKPHHRALVWASVFILVGSLVFQLGYNFGFFSPTRERIYLEERYRAEHFIPEDYPSFNGFVYSLDAFIPFINMHQEDFWLPNANRVCQADTMKAPCGSALRFYLWFHIAMGWVVATLFAIGFTGAMRKES